MSLPKSPFAPSSSSPGFGTIALSILPPRKQVLSAFTFQYPLKLIAPDPHSSPEEPSHPVTIVFLLTYGGGLVGGDRINLGISLAENTRLVLVTQGSTKIFKSPSRSVVSGQSLDVTVADGASLCYLPDPTQPFGESVYQQQQTFRIDPRGGSSLCVLDWVSEGRRARGESWTLWRWKGRNEIREQDGSCDVPGRLLLRDAVVLSDEDSWSGHPNGLAERTNDMGVLGSFILYGPAFKGLGEYFMDEFTSQPRIGAKNWSNAEMPPVVSPEQQARERQRQQEKSDGVLWTAANIRGVVLVKFAAWEVDGGRRWLGNMIRSEGSVEKMFGPQALICLR